MATQPAAFPPGLHNVFLFAGFNALSFQIVLNSPMILCAKSLGASATVLGIVAGMMPLLALARRIDEPDAATLDELLREILIESPQRFWLRFWPRG